MIAYMPNDKAQSVDMMIKYLDWLRANKYLTENEVVLLDRGPGAKKGDSKSLNHGIKCMLYPVGAGSIQSPNDVHFHSQLKLRMHKALEMKLSVSREEKLKAEIAAYYAVPETTIKAYFQACGITGGSPPRLACSLCLGRIAAEDPQSEKTRKRIRECIDAYDAWNRKVKFSRGGKEPDTHTSQLPGTELDGEYWAKWTYQPRGALPAE